MSLKHIAASGTIAEEVISTVRTAQAFGTQNTLANLYDVPINESRVTDIKAAIWQGGGLSVFFFVIYSGYALGKPASLLPSLLLITCPAFDYGTTLINRNQGMLAPACVRRIRLKCNFCR